MKTLYIDCGMGAAGDMLTAALLELLPDREGFVKRLNETGIPGVTYSLEKSVKCGVTGSHMTVLVDGVEEESHDHHHDHDHDHHDHDHHDHEHHNHEHHHDHEHHHHHSSMHDIEHIVNDHMRVSDTVKTAVLAVYGLIAEAESHVHGVPVTEIHFHEVGTMDALADVTAVAMLMEEIGADKVVASPVHVGSGQVRCAHGILPVPAPATAYILQGIPSYGGRIQGELCTPTGAALLKYFVTDFGSQPVMTTEKIGYGMGKKDFEAANCVRIMLGETAAENKNRCGETENGTEQMIELSCNVDDMTAEEIGFATDRILSGGAREVYTVAVGMKKSRPGTLIRVICSPEERDEMIKLIYKYTTTIGVRETVTRRYILDRTVETINTSYGKVRVKKSSGYGVERIKYEYEDIAEIAREQGISLDDVKSVIETDQS